MKNIFTLMICLLTFSLSAQKTIDFESTGIEKDTFLNGSDLSGGFTFEAFTFPNNYNTEYSSWSGWAISSMRDTTTAGFTNQYSAIAGEGVNSSNTYAVYNGFGATKGFSYQDSTSLNLPAIKGFYITNSTYAYLSMSNGDSFAKKFGGETGDDPDYFLLTIKSNSNPTDSINFYLADYRSEDNSDDYIVKDWTYIDVTSLGDQISDLQFSLSSSDVGQYGMNTPAYFCVDNVVYDIISDTKNISADVSIAPNPVSDLLTIQLDAAITVVNIYNQQGQRVLSQRTQSSIDVQALRSGMYFVEIITEDGVATQPIIKL